MFNFLFEYQFPNPLPDDPDINFLKERYYKGLCVESKKVNEFCKTEFLPWTWATLYAPLLLLFLLYAPTLGNPLQKYSCI